MQEGLEYRQHMEMKGLVKSKAWESVLRSFLQSYDKVFSTRFHFKVKRKRGQFDILKVCLVIQGQRMSLKAQWERTGLITSNSGRENEQDA